MEWESIYDFVKWVMLREQLGAEYLDAYRYIKDATDNFENYNVGKFKDAFCDAVEQFKDYVERWFYQNPLEADYMPSDLCNGCYNEVMELLDRKLNGINKSVIKQPQPEAQITAHDPQPSFLQVEKVVQAFERGVEHGYIIKHDGKYKWIKDKGTLLCALIGTLLFGDEIGLDGDYKTKGGAETFPASDIENYFGLKDISKKRYQLHQKKPPRGYEEMKKKLIEQP